MEIICAFALQQNYPNPFNPNTAISYQLSAVSDVKLSIYNTNGQLVRTLINTTQPVGHYVVEWDSRDNSGTLVSSGVYVYRLNAGDRVFTRRMVLMR